MMQTKLDRWLIETFVYEYNILVIQPPKKKGLGVKVTEIPYSPSTPYKYKIWCKSKKKADRLIDEYREAGQTFKTDIIEKKHWYNPLINNKKKSFTFRMFWWMVTISAIGFGAVSFLKFSKTKFYSDMIEDFNRVMKTSNKKKS